jgi:hypothetical protein
MPFGVDYSQTAEDIIPEGEYEAIVKYAGEDVTKVNKTPYINVTLVIRNDVDQRHKNRYIRHSIWHKKEPSQADLACGGYSAKQIQSLSKAAGLPNGKKYDSLEDWCDDLANKPVRVTVQHEEYPEGSGTMHARIRWINESKQLPCRHVWKDAEDVSEDMPAQNGAEPAQSNTEFEEVKNITDGDLPF